MIVQTRQNHSAYNDRPSDVATEDQGMTATRLRPISDLRMCIRYETAIKSIELWDVTADMYRSLFKFGVFNAVQSQCFNTVSGSFTFPRIQPFDSV